MAPSCGPWLGVPAGISPSALNAAGKAALNDLSTMCVGDAIFGYAFKKSTAWTTTGESVNDIVRHEPRLRAPLDAQRIGTLKPAGPVRLATGIQDDIVPHPQARQLAVDWCPKGANVTYEAINLPNPGDGLLTNHLVPLLTDQGAAISWLTDRLSGGLQHPITLNGETVSVGYEDLVATTAAPEASSR